MKENDEEPKEPFCLNDNLGEFHEETYMQIWACEYDKSIEGDK